MGIDGRGLNVSIEPLLEREKESVKNSHFGELLKKIVELFSGFVEEEKSWSEAINRREDIASGAYKKEE